MSTADLCRYPQRPADPGRISVADMAELVGAGEAVQLLSEFNVGPTWWNGEWWYVPQGPGQGARGYVMADDELASELSGRFAVLRASAEFVAKIQDERRAAAAAGRRYPDTDEAEPTGAETSSGSS
jgi:hypothetical protein